MSCMAPVALCASVRLSIFLLLILSVLAEFAAGSAVAAVGVAL